MIYRLIALLHVLGSLLEWDLFVQYFLIVILLLLLNITKEQEQLVGEIVLLKFLNFKFHQLLVLYLLFALPNAQFFLLIPLSFPLFPSSPSYPFFLSFLYPF